MPNKKTTTIYDVAEACGLSVKTVSRVINNDPTVKPHNANKVHQSIEQLNYKPDISARRLRTKQSYLIALLYMEYSGNFYSNMITSGAIEVCDQLGYDLLVRPFNLKNCHQTSSWVEHIAQRSNPDGFVVVPPLSDEEPLLNTISNLDKPFIKIASLDRSNENTVCCDEISASKAAVNHLISLGHQHIAMVNYLVGHAAGEWRYDGYQQAIKEAGFSLDPDLVVQYVYQEQDLENKLRQLLTRPNRPTAIFAVNDYLAAIVYRLAAQLKLRIPYDLSVVGFDDDPLSEILWPPLTTVRQPIRELGKAATQQLISKLSPQSPVQQFAPLHCELVIRNSCGPLL